MTITTFAANENNDMYIGPDGNLAVVYGLEAVLQICECVVKAIKGEMIFNTDLGLPDFQTVWNGVPKIAQYEAALLKALQNVNGVQRVSNLTVTVQNNKLSYVAVIQTIYGEGNLNGGL